MTRLTAMHPREISAALNIPEGVMWDILSYLTYHGYVLRRQIGRQCVFQYLQGGDV